MTYHTLKHILFIHFVCQQNLWSLIFGVYSFKQSSTWMHMDIFTQALNMETPSWGLALWIDKKGLTWYSSFNVQCVENIFHVLDHIFYIWTFFIRHSLVKNLLGLHSFRFLNFWGGFGWCPPPFFFVALFDLIFFEVAVPSMFLSW